MIISGATIVLLSLYSLNTGIATAFPAVVVELDAEGGNWRSHPISWSAWALERGNAVVFLAQPAIPVGTQGVQSLRWRALPIGMPEPQASRAVGNRIEDGWLYGSADPHERETQIGYLLVSRMEQLSVEIAGPGLGTSHPHLILRGENDTDLREYDSINRVIVLALAGIGLLAILAALIGAVTFRSAGN